MFGFALWVVAAAAVTLIGTGVALFGVSGRPLLWRLMLALGIALLAWGTLPVLGGGGISPYLLVGSVILFGFLVLSEAVGGDDSSW